MDYLVIYDKKELKELIKDFKEGGDEYANDVLQLEELNDVFILEELLDGKSIFPRLRGDWKVLPLRGVNSIG